jgi:hypothetical protein
VVPDLRICAFEIAHSELVPSTNQNYQFITVFPAIPVTVPISVYQENMAGTSFVGGSNHYKLQWHSFGGLSSGAPAGLQASGGVCGGRVPKPTWFATGNYACGSSRSGILSYLGLADV